MSNLKDKANEIARKGSLLHNVSAEVQEAYKQGYEDGCYATSWIPVAQEIPKDGELCVVVDKHNFMFVAYREQNRWCEDNINFDGTELYNIVAWIPITEYKENVDEINRCR